MAEHFPNFFVGAAKFVDDIVYDFSFILIGPDLLEPLLRFFNDHFPIPDGMLRWAAFDAWCFCAVGNVQQTLKVLNLKSHGFLTRLFGSL